MPEAAIGGRNEVKVAFAWSIAHCSHCSQVDPSYAPACKLLQRYSNVHHWQHVGALCIPGCDRAAAPEWPSLGRGPSAARSGQTAAPRVRGRRSARPARTPPAAPPCARSPAQAETNTIAAGGAGHSTVCIWCRLQLEARMLWQVRRPVLCPAHCSSGQPGAAPAPRLPALTIGSTAASSSTCRSSALGPVLPPPACGRRPCRCCCSARTPCRRSMPSTIWMPALRTAALSSLQRARPRARSHATSCVQQHAIAAGRRPQWQQLGSRLAQPMRSWPCCLQPPGTHIACRASCSTVMCAQRLCCSQQARAGATALPGLLRARQSLQAQAVFPAQPSPY